MDQNGKDVKTIKLIKSLGHGSENSYILFLFQPPKLAISLWFRNLEVKYSLGQMRLNDAFHSLYNRWHNARIVYLGHNKVGFQMSFIDKTSDCKSN